MLQQLDLFVVVMSLCIYYKDLFLRKRTISGNIRKMTAQSGRCICLSVIWAFLFAYGATEYVPVCPGCSVTPSPIHRTCNEAPETGPCRAAFPRFFYNTTSCKCEQFTWGGCGGNGNNYETLDACLKQCDGHSKCGSEAPNCYLPPDSGPCDALIERYYYDANECECRTFNYGGCKGNSNNFASQKLCMNACGNATCPVCNLPAVTGLCFGYFPSYFYNAQTCQCEKFIYGGCGGNGNRYETIQDCQAVCGSVTCPICNLPPSRGPCKAKLERWYFDAASCSCKTFTYGGCKGNLNRFLTKQDCEGSCGSYPCPVCSLEMKAGPCRAAIPRWYYDTQDNKCKEFSWGGCEPNGNNFRNSDTCKKVCKG